MLTLQEIHDIMMRFVYKLLLHANSII